MINIPIAKPYLTKEDAKAAYDAVLSGWVTQGPRVEEFERNFARYVGSKYAVAVSSCTTALHLAMIVAGVGAGDEVICPSLSFIATANSARYVGAVPVFADVSYGSYNIDSSAAEKLISKKTKAILIVHQMGFPADIDVFKKICQKHNLKLIEDAACAVGSEYKHKKIGSHSDLVCFSFHPRKVITTGDGGMITTSNKKYYNRLKILRQHAMSVNDRVRHLSKKIVNEDYLELGFNFRMTDIQGAIGNKQLEKLKFLLHERRKIAGIYNTEFAKVKNIVLTNQLKNTVSNYQSYPIFIKNISKIKRDKIMQKLLDIGISTRCGIMLIHETSAYKHIYKKIKLPFSQQMSDSTILLPLYFPMSKREIDYVVFNVKKLVSQS